MGRLDELADDLKKYENKFDMYFTKFNNGIGFKRDILDKHCMLYLCMSQSGLLLGYRNHIDDRPIRRYINKKTNEEVIEYCLRILENISNSNNTNSVVNLCDVDITKQISSNRVYDDNLYANTNFYTSTYSNFVNNFAITNAPKELDKEYIREKDYAVKCIAKNLILGGSKAKLYRADRTFSKDTKPLFNYYLTLKDDEEIVDDSDIKYSYLFDESNNEWNNTIKGGDYYNPALEFYSNILPNYLNEIKEAKNKDYTFITSMILPEASFATIITNPDVSDDNEVVSKQFADFYLPFAHLVIEIDGIQHKNAASRLSDKRRDDLLRKYGVRVIRISTLDFINKNELDSKLNEILKSLECSDEIQLLKELWINRNDDKEKYLLEASLRFEIVLLEILKNKRYNESDILYFNFINTNEEYKNAFKLAYESIRDLLSNLYVLADIDKTIPDIDISFSNDIEKDKINIDFNLFKHYDENILNNGIYKDIIYVRNAYCDNSDYYVLDTACKIKYDFTTERKKKDRALEYFLKNIFGYSRFKNGQKEIIKNTLSDNTTIGILPTGTGKSLCYQLCALLEPCISFSIEPIISLTIDQKRCLDEIGFDKTNYIISTQEANDKSKILYNFGKGRYQLIWISPERFQTISFREKLNEINTDRQFGFAVIDEVHCLSEWGHDFRTSYLTLIPTVNKYCNSATLLGLTATASQFVIKDLMKEFNVDDKAIKTLSSLERDELCFYVVKTVKEDKNNNVTSNNTNSTNTIVNNLYNNVVEVDEDDEYKDDELVEKYNMKYGNLFNILDVELGNDAGLIFELFASDCGITANQIYNYIVANNSNNINQQGLYDRISVFHGKMDPKEKFKNQQDYMNDVTDLMVATKAFGMGINKTNIKYTIHKSLPQSLESFYQEAGRAGREIFKTSYSHCYIVYTPEHGKDIDKIIEKLFDVSTTYDEIKELTIKLEEDLGKIFFLYVLSNDSILYLAKEIVSYLLQMIPNGGGLVKNNHLVLRDNSKEKGEKILYKLAVLGLVEDWTIVNWFKPRMFDVEYSILEQEEIENNLIQYIKKYDPEFDFNKMKNGEELYKGYSRFFDINSDINKNIFDNISPFVPSYNQIKNIMPYVLCLLQWQEDNIIYNKRQNIKTMMDLCDNYTTSAKFKAAIDNYFTYSRDTVSISKLIEKNIKNYNSVMSTLFVKKREGMKNISNNKTTELIDNDKLEKLNGIITRNLESYRRNSALDYLCGLVRLLLSTDNQKLFDRQTSDRLKRLLEREKSKNFKKYKELVIKTYFILKSKDDCVLSNYFNLFDEAEDPDFLEELYEITNSNYFKNKLFNKANMNYTQLPDDNTTRKNRPGKVRAENKKMKILGRKDRIKNSFSK